MYQFVTLLLSLILLTACNEKKIDATAVSSTSVARECAEGEVMTGIKSDGSLICRANRKAFATGNGPADPSDSGVINSRLLIFNKTKTDTVIRISYTDNLRVYSAGSSACRWEIKVDGLSCPGQPLTYDYYQNLAHENIHRSRTVVGYCKGISAGNRNIQIYVSGVPAVTHGDCDTGWNNSTWVIETEEIEPQS